MTAFVDPDSAQAFDDQHIKDLANCWIRDSYEDRPSREKRLRELCAHTLDRQPRRLSDDDLRELLWIMVDTLRSDSDHRPLNPFWRGCLSEELERALLSGQLLGDGRRGPKRNATVSQELHRLGLIYVSFYKARELGSPYYDAAEQAAEYVTSLGFKTEPKTVRDTITELNHFLEPCDKDECFRVRFYRVFDRWMIAEVLHGRTTATPDEENREV